jgi:16S rRNA pseudouridine516 synthase
MQSKRSRLDRYLSRQLSINRRAVRMLLAQGRVRVDQHIARDIQQRVDQYTHVQFDDQVLQAQTPSYLMLHKPRAVVSATQDARHTTAVDLLPHGYPENLHIAGRLDYNSTGLLLLTNDGRWSRRLTLPGSRVAKRYRVVLDKPVNDDVITAFARGMYFAYESITTRPARLRVIDERTVEVVLNEGRYHQIKRMFGYFQIEVLQLHRIAIGSLALGGLAQGQCRPLTPAEVANIFDARA